MSDIKEESQSSVDVLNDNIKRDIDQTIETSQSTLSKDSILTTETDKIAESEITEKSDAPENKESKDKNENVNSSDISSTEDKNNSPVDTDSLQETAEPLDRMRQKLIRNNGDSLIDQDKNIDQLENNNLINTESVSVGESIASAVSQDDTGKNSEQLVEKEDASGEQMEVDHEKEKICVLEEAGKDDQSEQEMEEDSKETAKGKDDDIYQSLRAEEIISITDEQPNELDEYKLRATEGRAAAEEGENDNSELVSSEGLVVGSFKMPQNILEGVEDTELVQAIRCAALSPLPDATPADIDSEITEILDKTNSPKQARVRTNSTKSSSAQDNRIGSLGLLAMNYDSDVSENEERENDVATDQQDKDQYRSIPLDLDSSSSSSDSDVEIVNEPPKIIDLDMLDDDEDEENPKKPRGPLRAKGEMLLEDLPPIQDLQITVPEYECVELGKVHSIVDQLVLVDSIPGTVPLNLDTVLFLEKGKKVLGEVFDVLGQVSNPLYCVRFNSNEHIKEKGVELGQTVYVAPRSEHTQFVILPELMQTRGSDASWQHDIEPSEKHLDYSDDEEERKAKISHRNKNRSNEEPEIVKKQRVTPGANRHSRAQYREQGDQGNYYHPSPQYAQPPQQRSPFPNPSQQYPQFNQYPENQYHYNDAGSSWHANYANNQYVPNPFSRPQYISPNAMHKAVFPAPPPPPPPHNQ